jgi:hypothetical protein
MPGPRGQKRRTSSAGASADTDEARLLKLLAEHGSITQGVNAIEDLDDLDHCVALAEQLAQLASARGTKLLTAESERRDADLREHEACTECGEGPLELTECSCGKTRLCDDCVPGRICADGCEEEVFCDEPGCTEEVTCDGGKCEFAACSKCADSNLTECYGGCSKLCITCEDDEAPECPGGCERRLCVLCDHGAECAECGKEPCNSCATKTPCENADLCRACVDDYDCVDCDYCERYG